MYRPLLLTLVSIAFACFCRAQQAPGDCLPTFQKTYTAPGNYNAFYIHTTPDGGSIIAGNVNPVTGDPNQESPLMDAFVMKLNAGGTLQWAKRIGSNFYDEFKKIKPTRDGGYIAIGLSATSGYSAAIYLVKLSASGDIEWSRNYKPLQSMFMNIGRDVIETADGGFVFAGTVEASLPYAQGVLVKTDAAGNTIWGKQFYHLEGTDIHSVVEDADTLVLGADYWASLEQKYYGSLIKVNKYTGAVIASIGFTSDNKSNFGTQVYKTASGLMAGVQLIDGRNFNTKQQGIVQFDQQLAPISNLKLINHDLNPWSSIVPTSDGGFIASAGRLGFGNSYYLYKVDKTGAFNWQKTYGNFPGIIMQVPANVQQYANGTYISACTYYDPVTGTDGKIHVIKVAPDGTTPGCRVDETSNTINTASLQTSAISWNHVSDFVYITAPGLITTSADISLTATQKCQPTNCTLTGIRGNDRVCARADTLTYVLQRSGACTSPATWTIDPDSAQVVATTDSSIRVVFKKTGTITLQGHLATPCTVISESITITIFDTPASLSLGPDIPLCGASRPLQANPGFAAYQWQDGSTNPVYTAASPGTYHVLATDHCGHPYRDTITLGQAAPVMVSLGRDTSLCPGEPLVLTPGNGFAAYQWSNGAVTSTCPATQPGTYWVQVTDHNGCTGTDSIRLTAGNCDQWLHLPNAFSPNHDRQNDLFRPLIAGQPDQFRLTVYNRWGARIFESTDARKGWDGTFKGQPQPAGTYVWTCRYKLSGPGQTVQSAKGVVMLVR